MDRFSLSSSRFKELQYMLLSGFEELCNRALSFDEASRQAFADLEGRTLNVQTFLKLGPADFEFCFDIQFNESGLIFSAPMDESIMDADASIRVSSFRLFAQLLRQRGLLEDERILIFGDRSLVSEVESILFNLDLDWEEPLSRVTGDVVAREVSRVAQDARSLIKNSGGLISSLVDSALKGELPKERSFRSKRRSSVDEEMENFEEDLTELGAMQESLEERVDNLAKAKGE